MRKETIESLVKVLNTPNEECKTFIVHYLDQFGNEVVEEILVPFDGSVTDNERGYKVG